MPFRFSLLLLFAAFLVLPSGKVSAQVQRCVTADGQAVFTDRQCAQVGATDRLQREAVATSQPLVRACARTVDDLVFAMTQAIDAHDANRLAEAYHWPGISSSAGFQIWQRLDQIANRPLVDIVPVMASARGPGASAGDAGANVGGVDTPSRTVNAADFAAAPSGSQPDDSDLYPQFTVRQDPVALRVEQTQGNGATPAQTLFTLTQHLGCWWVKF